MSIPQSNSTQMTEIPVAVEDRTRRTPEAPLTAVSIGNVTNVSTSSGAIPCASVMIVTEGAVRSGKTSTGILTATIVPPTRTTAAMARTINRFARDQPISLAIMLYPSFEWLMRVAVGRKLTGKRAKVHAVGAFRHDALPGF